LCDCSNVKNKKMRSKNQSSIRKFIKKALVAGADHPDNGVPDVLPIVQQYQPNCLFYHNTQLAEVRRGGSELGTLPYPCRATYPNCYSHAGDTLKEHLELLNPTCIFAFSSHTITRRQVV
jgi:hypothetical protein